MKALILANVGNEHFCKNKILPSCYLPLYNKMNVLERQISLLNVNGFTNDDICILFGTDGIWDIDSVKEITDSINIKKIYTERNNLLSKNIFKDKFFDDEDILIIDGNQVFDIAILSRLNRYKHDNVLVVKKMINPDNTDHIIQLEGNRVKAITSPNLMSFPWISFCGIARLSSKTVKELSEIVIAPMPLLEALKGIINKVELISIDYEDLLYGRLNGGHSNELTGGSYANLNYRLVVKKKAQGEGREKLINEIKWLLDLPKELKPYFSEVLEYDIDSPEVYFDVPYYGSRNLREHIFDGHFDANATIKFLEKLLNYMFENVYSRKISNAPFDWAKEKHVRRVLDRLDECSKRSNVLEKIINAKSIEINGIRYRNIKEIFTQIEKNKEFLQIINPKDLVMIHGDLHFQNILIYPNNDKGFMLVDPRGELNGSDLYYDMGKLWHSFHGKYDYVHSDQFKLDLLWNDSVPIANYELTNKFSVNVYDEIYDKFLSLIVKYDLIHNDPYWEMKALFAEAADFASVSIFHIGKTNTSDRTIVLYLIGVQLVNEFYNKYLVNDKWKNLK